MIVAIAWMKSLLFFLEVFSVVLRVVVHRERKRGGGGQEAQASTSPGIRGEARRVPITCACDLSRVTHRVPAWSLLFPVSPLCSSQYHRRLLVATLSTCASLHFQSPSSSSDKSPLPDMAAKDAKAQEVARKLEEYIEKYGPIQTLKDTIGS